MAGAMVAGAARYLENIPIMIVVEPDSAACVMESIKSGKIEKIDIDINKATTKLNNENFVNRAPKEIIEQEKERLRVFSERKDKFLQQLKKLQA